MSHMDRAPLAHSLLLPLFLFLFATVHSAPTRHRSAPWTRSDGGKLAVRQIPDGRWEIDLFHGEQVAPIRVEVGSVVSNPETGSSITCQVDADVDPAYVKTFWFKHVSILGSSHEWRLQYSDDFADNTMTLTVGKIRKTTLYKCRACITREPAANYKRSSSSDQDQCQHKIIEVIPSEDQ